MRSPGSKQQSSEAKYVVWNGDGAVSRLVREGDLINRAIHHQFPCQGTTESQPTAIGGERGVVLVLGVRGGPRP